MDESKTSNMGLPGFRFHPTEEELLDFYLKNTILGVEELHYDIIGFLNIYRHDPWVGKDWGEGVVLFVPRDTKHGHGGRPNRTTEHGFWKATGSDRKIFSFSSHPKRVIGLKKTLVFYKGRAPRGTKTDWVMNEYRLPDSCPSHKDIVLCKIYRKATSLKELEQRAAMEEEEEEEEVKTTNTNTDTTPPTPPISSETDSFCSQNQDLLAAAASRPVLKKEEEEEAMATEENFLNDEAGDMTKCLNLQLPTGMEKLELQLPKFGSQDPFYAPLCSPWLDNWLIPYANVLNL